MTPLYGRLIEAVARFRGLLPAALIFALLSFPATAAAQRPWTVTIRPSTSPLPAGQCTPIRLDIVDGATGDIPRGSTGRRVELPDFDMSIAPAGSFVGRYDGAAAWYACACPNSSGSVGTITATYPAKNLADKSRVQGVAISSTATIAATQRNNSGMPIGCETIRTATVSSGTAAPWAVTVASGVKALAIGNCTAIGLDLRDASGKERPRNPAGQLVSIADFDMSASAESGSAVAGKYDGRWSWSVCGCQGSIAGAPVTITASYPAHPLPEASRVRDIAFQSSVVIPLSPPPGMSNPPACASMQSSPAPAIAVRPAPAGRPIAGEIATLAPPTAAPPVAIPLPAGGREPISPAAPVPAPATAPNIVNPSGFAATQTGDGQVQLTWQPVSAASYYVILGPGSINGGVKVSHDTTFTVTGVPVGAQEFKVASYYEPGPISTPGTSFPTATVNVVELLTGWVDLHTHPMINLAFGGKLVHGGVDVGSLLPTDNHCGRKVRATSMAQALGDDRPSHGGWNLVDFPCGDNFRQFLIHEFQDANGALVTGAPANGYPTFDQWPKWNDLTHQKMWYEWIERARDGGLRVMVALATNNTTLGDAVSGPGDGPTDDKSSADLQLAEIKSFVLRHNAFMEIALNAADVKRIVKSNRIAVVLGMEVDNIGNFNKMNFPMLPPVVQQQLVTSEIQRLYNDGVRYVIPVHIMDNVFGGTAIYKNDFNTANLREAGYFWTIECANVSDDITHAYAEANDPLRAAGAFVKLGLDPLRVSGPPPVCPPSPQPAGQSRSRGMRNARTLTPLGAFAIRDMMRHGMLIDIDHMGQKTSDATLDIAEANGYPLVSGHTGIRGFGEGSDAENSRTPAQLTRISKLHGMFGLGSDGIHSSTWASNYQQAIIDMGYMDPSKGPYKIGAVAFGTDLNGLVKGPKPGGMLPNGQPRVVYDASFAKSTSGSKAWDYNTEGVAHYGMMSDFVKDLRNAKANGYRNAQGALGVDGPELVDKHLFRSANYFWEMWALAESKEGGVH